jgi:hypothetical protein
MTGTGLGAGIGGLEVGDKVGLEAGDAADGEVGVGDSVGRAAGAIVAAGFSTSGAGLANDGRSAAGSLARTGFFSSSPAIAAGDAAFCGSAGLPPKKRPRIPPTGAAGLSPTADLSMAAGFSL